MGKDISNPVHITFPVSFTSNVCGKDPPIRLQPLEISSKLQQLEEDGPTQNARVQKNNMPLGNTVAMAPMLAQPE